MTPRVIRCPAPERLEVVQQPLADLHADSVRVAVEFAAVKHGTEFHLFSGTSPFNEQRFDKNMRMFVPREESIGTGGLRFIGNIAVGKVIEVGAEVETHHIGDRVYGYSPAAEVVDLRADQARTVDPPMTAEDATCTDPALFALAAVRDAQLCLGDSVVVFGLGAIGLFVVQMCRRVGCHHVVAVDPIAKRRELATGFGADLVIDPTCDDVGLTVRDHLGRGADVAIEASGSYRALADGMRAVGRCGRVIALGYYKGQDSQLTLGSEFLHNRLELICSMPVWGNPMREHPLWDEARLHDTVHRAFVRGDLTARRIVDPVVSFDEAVDTFLRIYRNPGDAVKLGIRFDGDAR